MAWKPVSTSSPARTLTSRGPLILGLILLVLFCVWWTWSLKKNQLAAGRRTWVPYQPFLGLDFLNNYYAARHWQHGGNPYTEKIGDPLDRPFVYSPVLLVMFSWCRFFTARQAVAIWTLGLMAMAALGAMACRRNRTQLGLWPLPLPFLLAAVLCSTPVAFALERGNCDLLVLLMIVAAVPLLSRRSFRGDLLAGACFALATWSKSYAGVLGLALLAMRRPRAAGCMALMFVLFAAVDLPDTLAHIASTQNYLKDYDMPLHWSAHPFAVYWPQLWHGTRLATLPGILGATVVLLPIVVYVSWHIRRSPQTRGLLYPYFVWLAGVATFLAPVSNDYNLFFLPVAALAVWDRRDRVAVHLLMAFLLLWWQPVQLPIGHALMFCFKLGGVIAIAMCLVTRCREQVTLGEEEHEADEQHEVIESAGAAELNSQRKYSREAECPVPG
ncbi:MAG TPA: glycosyltransferase family 87 protein [Gemmataceae bacterium]|nr:glycosyltransferase family 87 protein [Gemmataceae bacterium]